MPLLNFQPHTQIPASKSIMNRLVICKSYFPNLEIQSDSNCEDVVLLREALGNINRDDFYVGSGGTTLRFLSLRLSRYPGKHRIRMTPQLMSRPHADLKDLLEQLGIANSWQNNEVLIEGGKWNHTKPIEVGVEQTSQILSSLLLNAWLLEDDLEIHFRGELVSPSYLKMTLEILHYLGMHWLPLENGLKIPKGQTIRNFEVKSEIDMSSAFSVAALCSINKNHCIEPFNIPSIQADAEFVRVLQNMGVDLHFGQQSLHIQKCETLKGITYNLHDCPDLFPVLAMLCSMAEGESKLYGAPHLVYKESNRIASIAHAFEKLKIRHERLEDGIWIAGQAAYLQKDFTEMSCFEDHRIAFALALAKLHGHNIKILGSDCVKKSYPSFWQQFDEDFCEKDLYL